MMKRKLNQFAFGNMTNIGAAKLKNKETFHAAKIDPIQGLIILCKCVGIQKFSINGKFTFFNNALGNCNK